MKKVMGSVLLVGALLTTVAGATEKTTEDVVAAGGDSLRESLLYPVHSSSALSLDSLDWSVEDSRFDPILLAQNVKAPAQTGPKVSVMANNNEVMVGVSQDFSTWSDMTAIFRPSRWKNPLRQGGSVSWLNYKAWGSAPGRTAKVLLGEAIVAGAAYAIYDATQDDDDDSENTTVTVQPTTTSSSGGSSNDDDDEDPVDDPIVDPVVVVVDPVDNEGGETW